MKAKPLYTTSIVCIIIVFFSFEIIGASSDNLQNEFRFYNIGPEDSKDTAAKKIDINGFQCLQGKAAYFHFEAIHKQSIYQKKTERIEEFIAMDEDFKNFGEGIPIKDLPVDILHCRPPENSPFEESTFYFSTFDHKLLAIGIEIKRFDLIKDKLTSKFGSCITKGYCEIGNSMMILAEIRGLHLKVYYYGNMKSHYNKLKEQRALKDKKMMEQNKEAF